MKHLVVIRIKNSDFDYAKYGLKNNYFSIDISNSFNYSKGVGFTQYALLDGTTRVDNISREPASLTLQGLLGEVRGGGSPENFVYATAEKNRLQNQMDLLEALRDQAIFLDFITDERTYKNYLIKSLSFGKSKFGQVDAQLTIQEVITFGDQITVENTQNYSDVSNYEQELILDSFQMRPINSDADLVNELNRLVTASVLSTPFIISFGSVNNNVDVVTPEYRIVKTVSSQQLVLSNPNRPAGTTLIVSDTNRISKSTVGVELISGVVIGNYYLHITIPTIQAGTNLYDTLLTKNPSGAITATNIPKTKIHIRLHQNNEQIYAVQNTSVLTSPQYSDIANGVHFLSTTGSNSDVIATVQFARSFVRKMKNNKYILLPNLLGREDRGYLYRTTFEQATGSESIIHPGLVYIHPKAWIKVKSELLKVWSSSPYFKNKELIL